MSGRHQRAGWSVERQIRHRGERQTRPQLVPRSAQVLGSVHAHVGRHQQAPRGRGIHEQVVHRHIGQVAGDRDPAVAAIRAAVDVRERFVLGKAGERDVDDVRVQGIGGYTCHPAHRQPGRNFSPRAAAVARPPDPAVVGAHVVDARVRSGDLERGDGAVDQARRRIGGQVGTDRLIGQPIVRAPVHAMATHQEQVVVARRDHRRRAPVVAIRPVEPHWRPERAAARGRALEPAAVRAELPLGEHHVGIRGIDETVEPVAPQDGAPGACSPARLEAVVVLGPAQEPRRVRGVDRAGVELRDRQVERLGPCAAAVGGRVEAAVVAEVDPRRVRGIDPDRVLIHVSGAEDAAEGDAAVARGQQIHPHGVDLGSVGGIDPKLAEVPAEAPERGGERAARGAQLPARAAILRPVEAEPVLARGRPGNDLGVDHRGPRGREREPDPPHVVGRGG